MIAPEETVFFAHGDASGEHGTRDRPNLAVGRLTVDDRLDTGADAAS